jgi:hypothetical protein
MLFHVIVQAVQKNVVSSCVTCGGCALHCMCSITFNIGTDNEIDERVKWEQSPRLQMLPEKMDISIKRRPTR